MTAVILLDPATYGARTRALGAWWCLGSSTLEPSRIFAFPPLTSDPLDQCVENKADGAVARADRI